MSRRGSLPLLVLLSGCAYVGPGENGTVLNGVRVYYVLKDAKDFGVCGAGLVGCTIPLGGACVVQLDRTYFERGTLWQKVNLVSHEVGHCMDVYGTGISHGSFKDQGRRWGPYWSAPAEGYAEAFARLYIAKCGLDLASLGWMNQTGPCRLPDPKQVTPQQIERRKL